MHASQKTICYYYHHLSTINTFFVVVHSVLSGHSKRSQAGPEHVIGTDQHQRK